MAKPPRNALLRGLWPGLRMGQTAGIVERLRWRKHPPAAATMALWCNWLTRRPLKAESPGSSPGNATKYILYNQSLAGCEGESAEGASLSSGYFMDTLSCQICCACKVSLPPEPNQKPGERYCARCAPRHRVLMQFMLAKDGWTVSFLEGDCKTS